MLDSSSARIDDTVRGQSLAIAAAANSRRLRGGRQG